jgi:hypothetical protein
MDGSFVVSFAIVHTPPKMAKSTGRQKHSCTQWSEVACTKGVQIFILFFWGGDGSMRVFFCCSCCVLIKFPMSSPTGSWRFYCVPQHVPNSFVTLSSHIFALSFTIVTYITKPKEEVTTTCVSFSAYPKLDFI